MLHEIDSLLHVFSQHKNMWKKIQNKNIEQLMIPENRLYTSLFVR